MALLKEEYFSEFARHIEHFVGKSYTFALAVAIIILWLVTGPYFNWSDTWQLLINTGTTIITFLMVFVIQNTQTRDTRAIQLKLDELIRVTEARNTLRGIERTKTEAELEQMTKNADPNPEPRPPW